MGYIRLAIIMILLMTILYDRGYSNIMEEGTKVNKRVVAANAKSEAASKADDTLYSLENEEGTRRLVLDNGLVVILKQKRNIPMVSMQMWVRAGSITEGENMGTGLSHYFEHMLGKRTKLFKGKEGYYNAIRSMGGSDANAYTTYDRTVYHFTVRKKYFDKALEALSEMIMGSLFDDEDLKIEKEVILKEINMGDDNPRRILWKTLMETVYKKHHYRYPVIGYRPLFKGLKKQDILDYYSTMYTPNNMILVIVGDFDLQEAQEGVRKEFKTFKRKKLPSLYIPREPKQKAARKTYRETGITTTNMVMAYPSVDALDEDVYALDVLEIILGGGKTSRLYTGVKDTKGLVKEIYASSWTPSYKGIFSIHSELSYKDLQKSEQAIREEIERVKQGVGKEELKRAKQGVLLSYIKRMQTLGGYASSLGLGEFLGDINYYKRYVEKVQEVKAEDVVRVAREYLRKERENVVILAPIGSREKVSEGVKKDREGRGQIKSIDLQNGIKLLLKKDSSIPMVSFGAVFAGGYLNETKESQGIYNFLYSTILKGTKTKSALEIAKLVEDTGGHISASSSDSLSYISGSFLKGYSDEIFELLLDILSNASFSKEEVEKERKDILYDIGTRDDDIWRASRYHLRKVRYKDRSYGYDGLGTTESIKKIKGSSLKRLYEGLIRPNNLVLSIFGDIDEEKLIKLFSGGQESKYNFLRREGTFKDNVLKPEAISKNKKETYYVKEKRKQSIVKIMYDCPSYKDIDSYALSLLGHIFSGIGSRLFVDLRGQEGLAYATGGFYQSKKDYGVFVFYIGTEPDKKERAISGMFRNIKSVRENGISNEELELAKNSAIGRITKGLETLDGQLRTAALNEQLGFGYNFHNELLKKLQSVTKEDIKRVANKYFTDKYVISVVESKNN